MLLTSSDTELILYATIQRLNDQNFRFETKTCADPQRDAMWEGSVVPSLKSYKQVHGDLKVPKMFVVPSEEPWPEEAWGLRPPGTSPAAGGHGFRVR